MISWRRLSLRRVALLGALVLAGCGGGGGSQDFSTCGNGRIDSGERCDDGNLDDTDACTSACQPARCGDGVVDRGAEDCDGRNLDAGACGAVGRAGDLRCDAQCHYDYSVCGDLFTPTPTPAVTPTVTATFTPAPPTATPTPTVASRCGDGLLSIDETCVSCASDCTPRACEATGAAAAAVSIALPAGAQITLMNLSLAYRTNTVSLPPGSPQSHLSAAGGYRVRAGTDTGYALAVVVAPQTQGTFLGSGEAFTIALDRCTGAAPPVPSDFACTVTNCGTASGCTCSVDVP